MNRASASSTFQSQRRDRPRADRNSPRSIRACRRENVCATHWGSIPSWSTVCGTAAATPLRRTARAQSDRLAGKRVRVARPQSSGHRFPGSKLCLEGPGLPSVNRRDGRSSANGRVVVLHLARSRRRNQFGQGSAPDASKGEVDNIGIAEKVIKKRFDVFQPVRSAQLKENYPRRRDVHVIPQSPLVPIAGWARSGCSPPEQQNREP